MSDLDVAMKLSLQYSPAGAKAAEADLNRVAAAADKLNQGGKDGGKLGAGFKKMTQEAGRVDQTVKTLKAGLYNLDGSRAFIKTTKAAKNTAKAVDTVTRKMSFWRQVSNAFRAGYNDGLGIDPDQGKKSRSRSAARNAAPRSIAGVLPINPATVAAGLGVAAYSALSKAAAPAYAFRKELADLKRATRGSAGDMDRYKDSIIRLSQETGRSKSEISALMAATARFSGGPKTGLERFTRYVTRTAAVWDESVETLGKGFTEIRAAWKTDAAGVETVGNAIGALAKKARIAETDLVEFVSSTGEQSARLKMGAEQVAAWGATFREAQVDVRTASDGFEKFQDVLSTATEGNKKFQKGLSRIGLSSRAVERAMKKDAGATMQKVLELVSRLPREKRFVALRELLGDKYADAFMGAVDNLGNLNRNLDVAKDKIGNAKAALDDLNEAENQRGARWQKLKDRVTTAISEPAADALDSMSDKILDGLDRGAQAVNAKKQYYDDARERGRLYDQQKQFEKESQTVARWQKWNAARGQYEAVAGDDKNRKQWAAKQRLEELHKLDAEVQAIFSRWGAELGKPFDLKGANIGAPVMELPKAAQDSMAQYSAVITNEGRVAIGKAAEIAGQIRSMLSFDARITITPTLSAPGISAPAANAPAGKPGKGAAAGGKGITIGTANFHGVKDVASLQRQLGRLADAQARGQRDDALHATGSFA